MARVNYDTDIMRMGKLALIFISSFSSVYFVAALSPSPSIGEPRLPNTSMTLGELWVYFSTWSGITSGLAIFWVAVYVAIFVIWVLWSWFFFGLFNGKNGGPYGSGYGRPQTPYYSRNLNVGIGDYLTQILELIHTGFDKFNGEFNYLTHESSL